MASTSPKRTAPTAAAAQDDEENKRLNTEEDPTLVPADRFVTMQVTRKATIKKFIEQQGYKYVAGRAYYQVIKPEIIDPNKKEIVLEKMDTGERITGVQVYDYFVNAPTNPGKQRWNPLEEEALQGFRMYVQSKSYNRLLLPNEYVLYDVTGMERVQPPPQLEAAMAVDEEHIHAQEEQEQVFDKTQLVISIDTTGSMAPCIESVKRVVKDTVNRLINHLPNIEIAIIAQGDYCLDHSTYLVKTLDFTRNIQTLCNFITTAEYTAGCDFEEAYEYVFYTARTKFRWEERSNKGMIFIADALPHKPDYKHNTLRLDWRNEARLLQEANIQLYAVRCLDWKWGVEAFWKELAQITHGYYLRLAQFQAIPAWLIAISYRQAGDYAQLEQFEEEMGENGQMTRNFHQLFATLAGGRNAFEAPDEDVLPGGLRPVAIGRFQVLDITERTPIKNFVTRMGAAFRPGKGFYEWIKPEEVQNNKEIVLMDKATGDMWTGADARRLASIPPHQPRKKFPPPAANKYAIFIQSTSYNRALVPPQRFLYEVDNV